MNVQKYLDLLYDGRAASLAVEKATDIDAWRAQVRAALTRGLGEVPAPLPPLGIRSLEPAPEMDVDIQRIAYRSEEGLDTPAYVLRPKGAQENLPAVVAVTGHGYGHRDCVGLTHDGRVMEDIEAEYTRAFALKLCRRGFLVIAPEPLGFGDLRLPEDVAVGPGQSSCQRIDGVLKMLGRSLGGARVLQALRAIDVLQELGADRNRIGMMGISGGGLVTAFAAALDDRIRACVVSGYANTFKKSVMAVHHCVDNFYMGLARDLELPDILASIAPRPMLWEAGDSDDIFPIDGVREARDIVLSQYRRLGAEQCFELDEFHGGHRISGARAYDFLWEALG